MLVGWMWEVRGKKKKKILGVVDCGTDTEKARTVVSFRGKKLRFHC